MNVQLLMESAYTCWGDSSSQFLRRGSKYQGTSTRRIASYSRFGWENSGIESFPRIWIERGGPITWYPGSPKPISLDCYFGVTSMLLLLTFHHCQPICQKFFESWSSCTRAMQSDVWTEPKFTYFGCHATHDSVTESYNPLSVVHKISITKLPEK